MRAFVLLAVLAAAAPGQTAVSRYLNRDVELTADPEAAPWSEAPVIVIERGRMGEAVPGHRSEVRLRWTKQHLYVLYTCPYERLNLRPNARTATETNRLWEWDVAELFIGADFERIWKYREYQVSPQGEWVDLDIDRRNPLPQGGWMWNSGFRVAARIDAGSKVWYGAMKIPFASITDRFAHEGMELRANFYRIQGPAPRVLLNWRPTGGRSFHIPESFGLLRLEK